MKKFLSLVLALVMTMSLVTVSAGAKDFTDSDKIQYTEAVDVMSAVKVIDGYADGSFNPTATLTRGAAAKIICNLILGPTTANALVADAAPYKDVPTNHTFAGYIAYCQKEGIVDGYADGTFKPANSLTGYAFMKMLLGALGYDAEVEGYSSPNWSINVAKRALNIGLDDGLVGNFNGVKAVNREEACLYALNTLTADMVEYDAKTSVSAGNTTVVIAGSKAKEMVNNGTSDGKIFGKDGVMQFAEKYFDNLTVKTGSDEFERPANVWKLKAEEIGTYSNTPDLTYTKKVEAGDIYKDLNLGSTVAAKDVTVYVNGVEADAAEIDIKKGSDDKIGDVAGVNTNGNGVLTEVFYDDDADTITITQIVTYIGEIAKTVKATDKKDAYVVVTGKAAENNKFATIPESVTGTKAGALEFETDEKFADETYVLYTYSFKEDEVESVVAAEKVEGYVSQTINKTSDLDQNNGMTIAGTAYKMSKAAAGEKLGNVSVKQDYTVYLDQYGYIIYVEEIQEIGNYALVLATASKGSFIGNKAQILLTDGTVKFVNTDENYASGDKKIADNTIVTFRENSDGTYTLKTVKKNNATATVATDAAKDFVMKNDKAGIELWNKGAAQKTTVTANSASVFVVADQDDYNVKTSEIDDWDSYTGIKNAPTVTTKKDDGTSIAGAQVTAYYYRKNSMITVMFIVPNKAANVEDGTKNAIYFATKSASDLIHDEDGDYFTYNAIVDGKITTVKVDSDLTGAASLNGLYKSYGTNSKGYITSLKSYPVYSDGDTEQALNEGIGLEKTSKEYTVTLDTKCTADHKTAAHSTVNAPFTITVDDNAKIYFVDKKGNISESSYAALYPDDNDLVYAVVKDYLVKTLVVQEVKDNGAAVTPTLKPGQKPVATISGTVITVPVIDNAATSNMAQAAAALTNAGYSVTGSMGANTIMASKNGVNYVFVIENSYYVTLTVDDKVVEYVAATSANPSKASVASTTKDTDITGKGTYYNDGSYKKYADATGTAMIAVGAGKLAVTTGYVATIDASSIGYTGDINGADVKLTLASGAATNVEYNKESLKVAIDKSKLTAGDYTVTVTVTLDGADDLVFTDTAKTGADYAHTFNFGALSNDITGIAVKTEKVMGTYALTYTNATVTHSKGITMTLSGPASAKEGETVTVKVTLKGTATDANTFKITGVTPVWDTDATVTGLTTTTADSPVVANASSYATEKVTYFTFTMPGADTTIKLAAA